jgi:hypothetical protein
MLEVALIGMVFVYPAREPDVEKINAGLFFTGVSGRPRTQSRSAGCIWP